MRLYSIKDIATASGLSITAVFDRSKTGRKNRYGQQTESPWVPIRKKGKARLYDIDSLPADVRAALSSAEYRALSQVRRRLEKAIHAFDKAFGAKS